MKTMRTIPSILVIAITAGCGASNSDAPDAGPTADAGNDPTGYAVNRAGQVALIEDTGPFAMIYDRAFEQPLPDRIAAQGECEVYHRPMPSCAQLCTTEVCVADNQCAPFAAFVSAGDITLTGLRVPPVTLTPSMYGYVSPSVPADFFADEAAIHVAAAGDAIPAFTADLGGVAPLVHQAGGLIELRDGEDETIQWTPAAGGARIQVALFLGWHGAPWTDLLVCETADDGDLVIPAAMVERMPYFGGVGLFQWPSWIARFRRAWITSPGGPIEIVVASQVGVGMSHPGP